MTDVECPECHKQVTQDQRVPHAQWHWGDKLDKAAERNPEAKRRINLLTGGNY